DFRLLDAAGQTIAQQHVDGLAFLRFPMPSAVGRTQIVRLGLSEELKIYWCGWVGGGKEKRAATLTQPWGAGWRWDPQANAMSASGHAELVVRAPDRDGLPLFVDLECSSPLDFEVGDSGGQVLAHFRASGRGVHRLDLPFERGRTRVLDIAAAGSFLAFGCDWTENPGVNAPGFVHTNACGDFTLMARDHWFDLRGYPEFDMFSMNLDSMLCIAAHHGGAREEMLEDPMRIYHIEHGSGSGWTPEGQAKLFDRIAALGLSFVDNEDVLAWAAQMAKLNAPMIFNHHDWGMADVELKETVLPQ
ncbi:MAG TPA: hypothetical protein VGV35_10580, partial [Bryobacteraceae bacterium]|nr:hypothetical protein [Bryobacteraceae bacterium]